MSNFENDVVDLLHQLVTIDSVNPGLVPGAAGEQDVARFVAQWAQQQGLTAEVVEVTPGRPNVVVRSGGSGPGPVLMLCGHLDTVGLNGMTDPLTPRVEGDRLYARGAYDMKSGLAAALIACREAARENLPGEVIVAAVADEEHASAGIQEVLPGLRADAAIVTEPTELAIGLAHKGFVWSEIEVTGRAAHGSRPHLGVDAIMKTGPVLVALDTLNNELAEQEHPLLGAGTMHASLIEGGNEVSTVPDRCLLTIERRTLPGQTPQDVERDLEDLLARCREADPELTAVSRTTLAREPFEIGPESTIVRTVSNAAVTVLGRAPEEVGISFWADSAFIADAAIPTVLFGPNGEGAHADEEWVSLSGTVACARVLVESARAFRTHQA